MAYISTVRLAGLWG